MAIAVDNGRFFVVRYYLLFSSRAGLVVSRGKMVQHQLHATRELRSDAFFL
jgi:hypothetical protein